MPFLKALIDVLWKFLFNHCWLLFCLADLGRFLPPVTIHKLIIDTYIPTHPPPSPMNNLPCSDAYSFSPGLTKRSPPVWRQWDKVYDYFIDILEVPELGPLYYSSFSSTSSHFSNTRLQHQNSLSFEQLNLTRPGCLSKLTWLLYEFNARQWRILITRSLGHRLEKLLKMI